MKKVIGLIILISIAINPLTSFAVINNAGFEGGIHKNEKDYKDQKKYKEVIFITGEPIVLYGTVEIDIDDEDLQYEYELSSKDGNVTLERDIELERIIDNTTKERQIIEENNIIDYDEEITVSSGVGSGNYELIDYQLHNSTINDVQPVVDFYSGRWLGTKTYSFNNEEEEVIVQITGDIYGYDHYWGATETQSIHQYIEKKNIVNDTTDWTGYADINVSFNRTKRMEYSENLPLLTSYEGWNTLTEQEETVMSYTYNLSDSSNVSFDIRNIGEGTQRYETLPTRTSLYISRFEDIKGRWSEGEIKRLAGLGVVDGDKRYFGPKLYMKRVQFAKWIAKAMSLVKDEDKVERSYTKPEVNPPAFNDITNEHPEYEYIKAIKENGIMQGAGDNKFLPEGNLTRAQAITIVIRALGIERLAPNLPFETRFIDDEDIPFWAKKHIYVADHIDLAKGTPDGYIYPNEYMTKEEAAAFVNRFIKYLQNNLKEEYRENIINY